MTQHAGNSYYDLERSVTMHVDSDVDAGAVVEINGMNSGYTQVTPSGSVIDGVAADSASSGEKVDVVVEGDVWVRDSTGLSAGDTVGDGDTDSSGHLTGSAGSEHDVWRPQQADADGNNVSLVYLE